MTGAPVFLHHPSSLEHDTGPHPEQPRRITAILDALSSRDWLGWSAVESPAVDRALLTAVHPAAYVDALEHAADAGGGQLDADTVISSGSYVAALHAAGGAVAMVDALLDGSAPYGFSAHRPPGHHALPARAMGFCLFNNVAVASRYALDVRGLSRVLVLDWDVHHGNGTNDIFIASDQVLFISIHEAPLYPGTGPASEVGTGPGVGYTVNLPVPPRSGDDVYLSLVCDVAAPLVRAFSPELVLISAGFDAHADDPLADCMVSDAGFAGMAALMREACAEVGAPIGCVLEGGYDVHALARSVAATMGALVSESGASGANALPLTPVAGAARERLAQWWPDMSAPD